MSRDGRGVDVTPFHLKWSRVNQAWFVMFGSAILRIVNTRKEADALLREWGVIA